MQLKNNAFVTEILTTWLLNMYLAVKMIEYFILMSEPLKIGVAHCLIMLNIIFLYDIRWFIFSDVVMFNRLLFKFI